MIKKVKIVFLKKLITLINPWQKREKAQVTICKRGLYISYRYLTGLRRILGKLYCDKQENLDEMNIKKYSIKTDSRQNRKID